MEGSGDGVGSSPEAPSPHGWPRRIFLGHRAKSLDNEIMAKARWCLLVLAALSTLTACVTKPQFITDGPVTQIFIGTYDDVWRAAQKALTKYPIRINNSDTGILQTDHVRGAKAYLPPYSNNTHSSGYRHQITLRLARGSVKGQPAVKVSITKSPEMQRDFFSSATPLTSDGVEERVLMYRIQRELDLDRVLH